MDLNFKKIELSHKKIIENYFNTYHPKISEYTFTNLFIWSDVRHIRWSNLLDGIVFLGEKDNENYFFPPIGVGNCEKAFDILINYAIQHNVKTISLIPEYQIKFVKHRGLKIIADRDNFDYVYKSEKLAFLKGWRLDGKRGFIKKFRENYNFIYRNFEVEDKNACIKLFEKWLESKTDAPLANDEYKTFLKFMDNFEFLNAKGGIIKVDDSLVAFEFGEPLDKNTFVIHYEKADTSYIGSFQIINQQFTEHEIYPNYLFVNREQDMGVEGLRKAKLSYAPFKLIKKYEIKLTAS
ncbi:MAG: phosphatidylglycerol lysyltransferase domain-containing protein [Brevinematales bacterium]|nr:phosphatidylglycerol lysyltransferase domain-containing protein [Brevinematales bacterium]